MPYKKGVNMARCNLAEKPIKLIYECPLGMGSLKERKVRRYT
jgi:hypothetical protein